MLFLLALLFCSASLNALQTAVVHKQKQFALTRTYVFNQNVLTVTTRLTDVESNSECEESCCYEVDTLGGTGLNWRHVSGTGSSIASNDDERKVLWQALEQAKKKFFDEEEDGHPAPYVTKQEFHFDIAGLLAESEHAQKCLSK